MAKVDKIQLIHPEGKKAPAISKKVYQMFSDGIISTLVKNQPCTLTHIADGMKNYIEENHIQYEGSVEWFSVAVKQHLESEGVIIAYTEKGRKLHRLNDELE